MQDEKMNKQPVYVILTISRVRWVRCKLFL